MRLKRAGFEIVRSAAQRAATPSEQAERRIRARFGMSQGFLRAGRVNAEGGYPRG
ncbi:hypothetical protein [Methylocapsa acidiphila]|uniref:hypothetical protein n=1 Tax=Methylocapsa acidiphila TaxID=133552 RepID=UPI0003F7E8ED|nr:hypothetical protein [Methylocapsa acidiphila]